MAENPKVLGVAEHLVAVVEIVGDKRELRRLLAKGKLRKRLLTRYSADCL